MASPPKILILRNTTSSGEIPTSVFQAYGAQVTVDTSGMIDIGTVVSTVKNGGYTQVVIDKGWGGVHGDLLTAAYILYNTHGINVFTTGNDTTYHVGNPIWTGSVNVGATNGQLTPVTPVGTHPIAQGWTSHVETDARTYLTGVRSTAVVVGEFTHNTAGNIKRPAIIAEEHINGARYVHSQAYNIGTNAELRTAIVDWLTIPGGMLRVWNGSEWVWKSPKVYNGSWVSRPLKKWDGSKWIPQ